MAEAEGDAASQANTPSDGEAKSLGEANYEQFADRYATHAATKAYNAHYDRPNTCKMLPADLAGLAVLDAGCGPGFYTEILLSRGAQRVVAVDVTPAFVEMTRRRCARAEVLRADLTRPLCFARDAEFDLVVCPLVLDYVEDLDSLFAEFFRILKKPAGCLVFSVGHPTADWAWLKARQPDNATSYFDTQLVDAVWGGFGEPKPTVTAYRRPLGAFLNPLCDAGFRLDHFLEATPPTSMRDAGFTREFDKLSKEPGFMVVRATTS